MMETDPRLNHCDNCYSVILTYCSNYCSWCGRSVKLNTLEGITLETEEGRKTFVEREDERKKRNVMPAEHWIERRKFLEGSEEVT